MNPSPHLKRFEFRELREAYAHAEAGGQALHVWRPTDLGELGEALRRRAPPVFQQHDLWAHLIDLDEGRLVWTARRLGVPFIVVGRRGRRGQHVDLCGEPLRRALEACGP